MAPGGDELDQLWRQGSEELGAWIQRLAEELARATLGRKHNVAYAQERLAIVLGQAAAMSDLLGRRRVALETRSALRGHVAVVDVPDVPEIATVPQAPFLEAVTDILERTPELSVTGAEVAEVYVNRHGFALANSTSIVLTRKVQRAIGRFAKQGVPVPKASQVIAEVGGFTKSYAQTVYRTNLNTAYTAGRFKQASDPDIAKVMPALKVFTSSDRDVRRGREEDRGENHRAANGFIAATDDPAWDRISTPYGYECRCKMRLVSRFELERMTPPRFVDGRVVPQPIPRDFRAHPGFGGRPDRAIYTSGASFSRADFERAWPGSAVAESRSS